MVGRAVFTGKRIMKFIKVKVKAEAKENRIEMRDADSFEISVKEPAENNRANRAVISILAAFLKVQPQKLRLIKGHTSPAKIISVID